MSNTLSLERKTQAISMLCEGSSIRSVERIIGVHRDTIMRLGVRMGDGCKRIMDGKLRGLRSRVIDIDGLGIRGNEKTAKKVGADSTMGDVWTWIALDADTKLVPTFAVDLRSVEPSL